MTPRLPQTNHRDPVLTASLSPQDLTYLCLLPLGQNMEFLSKFLSPKIGRFSSYRFGWESSAAEGEKGAVATGTRAVLKRHGPAMYVIVIIAVLQTIHEIKLCIFLGIGLETHYCACKQ